MRHAVTGRLPAALYEGLDRLLRPADDALRAAFPGEPRDRQPVHTVYMAADKFRSDACSQWGAVAAKLLNDQASTVLEVVQSAGIERDVAKEIVDQIDRKLAREPIEDLRIDFEDGYGIHSDGEEDAVAVEAARQLALSLADGSAPSHVGIRFKSFDPETRHRGIRTLDLFLSSLLAKMELPNAFLLTLPKVSMPEQVEAMVELCSAAELAYGLRDHQLRFELQIETTQSVLGPDGTATVARMVQVADHRCLGLHFGTYDYTAACGIASEYQSLEHPAADFAKAVLQVVAAGTGVTVVDGSTNVIPVGDDDAVVAALTNHARLVWRALERGLYQGWDLHPGHLPTRYAANYGFFRQALPGAAKRLRTYAERRQGAVLDEPATARALSGVLLRGLSCGALGEAEVAALTGMALTQLEGLARGQPPEGTSKAEHPRGDPHPTRRAPRVPNGVPGQAREDELKS